MADHKTAKTSLAEKQLSVQIGARIKRARMTRRISQEALAAAIEITFQQLQKIENGENRCSAARLMQIATYLGCSALDLLPAAASAAEAQADDAIVVTRAQLLLINDLKAMSSEQRGLIYAMARALTGRKGAASRDGSLKVLARVAETADA